MPAGCARVVGGGLGVVKGGGCREAGLAPRWPTPGGGHSVSVLYPRFRGYHRAAGCVWRAPARLGRVGVGLGLGDHNRALESSVICVHRSSSWPSGLYAWLKNGGFARGVVSSPAGGASFPLSVVNSFKPRRGSLRIGSPVQSRSQPGGRLFVFQCIKVY